MKPDRSLPRPRVSLRDVARELGVSHVTVSLAIRGDPRISAERRQEVAAAAERMGYRPDPMLSSLSAYRHSKRPATIRSAVAWINQWDDPQALHRLHEYEAYWQGAGEAAAHLGYNLQEIVVTPDITSARLEKILTTRGIRGILIPPHLRGLNLPGFNWSHFSVVRLGVSVSSPRVHVITSDQINCASLAYQKLFERGYRRIGYVSSHRFDLNTGGNFRAGYLGQQDVFVPLRQHLPILSFAEDNTANAARVLRAWLKRAKPDALITTLVSLRSLLTRAGYKVPDDVAVAAMSVFDGNFDSGVDQNSREIGRVAMSTLAGLIYQNERGIPQYCRRILVEGRWVEGTCVLDRTKAASVR